MDYIVRGVLQAGILEWVAYPFSRGSSQPRNQTGVSCIASDSLLTELSGKTTLNKSLSEFPGGSAGKESTCNAGDSSLIPGLGRSPGEGIVYSLQYLWASLVAQNVKNPPAMLETWIRSLGWEDPLEERMAIHYSILALRIPMNRGTW